MSSHNIKASARHRTSHCDPTGPGVQVDVSDTDHSPHKHHSKPSTARPGGSGLPQQQTAQQQLREQRAQTGFKEVKAECRGATACEEASE